jgi:cytochrome c556
VGGRVYVAGQAGAMGARHDERWSTMADFDKVTEGLLDAIDDLAKKATATTGHSTAEAFSAAAKNLAEAHAWLVAPAQEH